MKPKRIFLNWLIPYGSTHLEDSTMIRLRLPGGRTESRPIHFASELTGQQLSVDEEEDVGTMFAAKRN